MLKPNFNIAKSEFVIFQSDVNMQALEELMAIVEPERDFRFAIDWLMRDIFKMCQNKYESKLDVELYVNSSWFISHLPGQLYREHWNTFIAHSDGTIEIADPRQDQRHPREIVKDLVLDICQQLHDLHLYDRLGKLMFEYDRVVPGGSLEIRLRRL